MKLPPLVDAAQELSREEILRYSRHVIIPELGMTGQQRLKTARVLVIGAGGLGSPALLYLAAAGVGTLGIVEFDVVEESNLQRQVIHSIATVGKPKALSAKMAIQELNQYISVNIHEERLEVSNARQIISQYDLIVDGTDNFATRYLVNDACVLEHKPYVWGSIFRFEGQASVFWEDAPGGVGLNYRDLYPEPPPPELAPSCAEGGVLGVLCASIGAIMGTEAVKLITGIGDSLLGRLMVYDALDMEYRTIPLRRAPDRKPITELADYQMFCGLKRPVVEEEVPAISALQLKQLQSSGDMFHLIDVREKAECEVVRIAGSWHVPMREIAASADIAALDREAPIVVHCKSGARSKTVLRELQGMGFRDVRNLTGGVLAWVKDVEPYLPTY